MHKLKRALAVGFFTIVGQKSVQRERKLPLMCLTKIAMLLV
jgi:hypothetical protein